MRRDGYMFESGFKILALDDKCGAVICWTLIGKMEQKNFKVFDRPEDER